MGDENDKDRFSMMKMRTTTTTTITIQLVLLIFVCFCVFYRLWIPSFWKNNDKAGLTTTATATAATTNNNNCHRRTSNWWFQTHTPNYTKQAIQIIQQHRSSLTGIYMYAGLSIDEFGTFQHPPLAKLVSQTIPFRMDDNDDKDYLDVGIALGVSQIAIEQGIIASRAVQSIAHLAHQLNVTSIMVDYEPRTNINNAHAQAYASFLRQLCLALHLYGVQCHMCVSSWSILTNFSLYANKTTGIDRMMSMASTYFGTNIRKNQEWVQKELDDGVSLNQLAVGIGSTNSIFQKWNYDWNALKFQQFLHWLESSKNICHIDLWRTDIDTLNATNGTPDWIYSGLEHFLHPRSLYQEQEERYDYK